MSVPRLGVWLKYGTITQEEKKAAAIIILIFYGDFEDNWLSVLVVKNNGQAGSGFWNGSNIFKLLKNA